MKKIWIDDVRPMPQGYDLHFKSVQETIAYLDGHYEDVELLNMDHDAGDFAKFGGDYIRILDWLEFMCISIPISIHSGNPVGIKNMKKIIEKNGWIYVPQADEWMGGF